MKQWQIILAGFILVTLASVISSGIAVAYFGVWVDAITVPAWVIGSYAWVSMLLPFAERHGR